MSTWHDHDPLAEHAVHLQAPLATPASYTRSVDAKSFGQPVPSEPTAKSIGVQPSGTPPSKHAGVGHKGASGKPSNVLPPSASAPGPSVPTASAPPSTHAS